MFMPEKYGLFLDPTFKKYQKIANNSAFFALATGKPGAKSPYDFW